MHADAVVGHHVVAQLDVFHVVDKESATVVGHPVAVHFRILQCAQHDAVIGVLPGAIVADGLITNLHQCQAAPVVPGIVVFPQVVVGIHVVRAVAAVVQPVALEDGVVRHVDVEGVTHEADLVADDASTLGVVELDAIAALGAVVVALAGDVVVQHLHVVGLLDPEPEQVVAEEAVAHDGTVRAGLDVDAGVLLQQAVARIRHDQPLDDDIGGDDADGVSLVAAADGGAVDAAQRQCPVNPKVFHVAAALDVDLVTGRGPVDGGLDLLARVDGDHGSLRHRAAQQAGQQQQAGQWAQFCGPACAGQGLTGYCHG